jgi:heme-binding protein
MIRSSKSSVCSDLLDGRASMQIVKSLGAAALFVGSVGVSLLSSSATASAQPPPPPPPNCTSADLAGVAAGVTAATSAYLFTHPDVNAYLTGLKGLPKDEVALKVREYGDAHPQVRAELQGIRQPMIDFRNRCG